MPRASPYFTFVHYYRERQRREGRNLSLDEAKAEADPIWAALPSDSRERFVEMAEVRGRPPPRRRQPPVPAQMSPHRVRMRGFIEKVLAMAQDVKTHPFHFLSFRRESNTRLPSEISVLRFSIEKGAHCFLHFLLNPEVSPGRYKLLSEKMTQQITVIPIEGTQNSKQNLEEVLSTIHMFCGGVVFVMTNEHQYALQCLKDLQEACPSPQNYQSIPLDGEELIEMLWERSPEGHSAQLLHVREACANQSGLDYLACEYHRASGDRGVCSLWKPYRLAYGLSQILARPYDIRIAEGYHRSRTNWLPVGTYFAGHGNYEEWSYSSTSTSSAWDSHAPSSSAQARGGDWGGSKA